MIKKLICFICAILIIFGSVALGEEWVCPNCNTTVSGNFCSECGTKKPSNEWICVQCGNKATGNFCSNCGSPRPAAATTVPEETDTRSQRRSGSKYIAEAGLYQFKVSDYWVKDTTVNVFRAFAERNGKVAMLVVQSNYDDGKVGFDRLDTDEERNDVVNALISGMGQSVADCNLVSSEIIKDDDIEGVLWYFNKIKIQGYNGEMYYLIFPSEANNHWVTFMCFFMDNTEYRYDEDFRDIIRSITKKKASSVVPTAKPTKTPKPTATPKPTKTPKPTATPKPTRTPSTLDSEKTVRVKLLTGKYVTIRKSVKDALDAYESFMDGYIDAMEKLSKGDFTGYLAFMTQYEEFAEKIDALEDDLTDEEALYYYEVIMRVNEKIYSM